MGQDPKIRQLVRLGLDFQFACSAAQLRAALRPHGDPDGADEIAAAAAFAHRDLLFSPAALRDLLAAAAGDGCWAPAAAALARIVLRETVGERLRATNLEYRRLRLAAEHERPGGGPPVTIPSLLGEIARTPGDAARTELIDTLCTISARTFRALALRRREAFESVAAGLGFATPLAMLDALCDHGVLHARASAAVADAAGRFTLAPAAQTRRAAIEARPEFAADAIAPTARRLAAAWFPAGRRYKLREGTRPATPRFAGVPPASLTFRPVAVLPTRSPAYGRLAQWALSFHELGHAFQAAVAFDDEATWAVAALDDRLYECVPALFEVVFERCVGPALANGRDPDEHDALEALLRREVANLRLFGGPVPYLLDTLLLRGEPPEAIEAAFDAIVGRLGMASWDLVPARGRACWYRMSELPVFDPEQYLLGGFGETAADLLAAALGPDWPDARDLEGFRRIESAIASSRTLAEFEAAVRAAAYGLRLAK